MTKTPVLLNKPVYLILSVLDLIESVMYKFRYDYVNPKYDKKAKICFMDTGSFNVHIKTDDIDKDIGEDDETRFYSSNYELNLPISYFI